MRNIRQRKIDPNKPMPVVIFYSLLNTYCNASSKSSTTSTAQESASSSCLSTTATSELLETMMTKLKRTNGYKNIENHYRNISQRLSMSDLDEMKLIMKESGIDEETLKSIRHAQEIADDQANNYTYDHTLDSDAHEDGHHSGSSRGGGLGNSRRGGSGAIKQSSHHQQSDQQNGTTEREIFTPFVNIIEIDNMELPDFDIGITPSSSISSVRSQFLETKEKKRRRNAEQRTSRKKVKYQPPPQYIHFHEKTTQAVEPEKILYDMEDEDFEWLSNFQTKYLEQYEMCICDNSITVEHLLKRWKVTQKDNLPTPSQVLHLFDEDFFEESIDRFEKTTAFGTELCSFKSAINKFPSLGRLFFDIEIFTHETTNNNTNSNSTRKSSETRLPQNNRNNRFLHSSIPIISTHQIDDRYKFNLFNQSTSNKSLLPPSNSQNPSQSEKSITTSLGNSRSFPSSSTTNGYNNLTTTLLPSQPQCINNNDNNMRENNSEKVLPIQFLYEIYLFWRSKRLSRRVTSTEKQLYPYCGKPLLVDFEKEPDINDQSHHAAFRLRVLPKKQTEEIQNDEISLYKLRKLKKELTMLKDLMTKVNERETKKLDHVKLTRDILLFEQNNTKEMQIPDPSSATNDIHTSILMTPQKESETQPTTETIEQPYYEPISEEAWSEQYSQDESGSTTMNLLHFMEILKKHNRPFFPFLLQYVKKTRGFEGDEIIPEQFNTMLPKYVPGSEYNVSLSARRDSVLFDTESLNQDELAANEMRMDYEIDNLLHYEIESQKKIFEASESTNGTCSTEMLLSMLDEDEKQAPQQEPIGQIVEVQLSEFEEKSSNPNENTSIIQKYPKTNENSFVYGDNDE